MNPMKYIQIGAVVGVVAMVITLKMLWSQNQELKAERVILKAQIETNEVNMGLLNDLLVNETKNRMNAQIALSELLKDVPDVVFSRELDPTLQGVINRFHTSIGR